MSIVVHALQCSVNSTLKGVHQAIYCVNTARCRLNAYEGVNALTLKSRKREPLNLLTDADIITIAMKRKKLNWGPRKKIKIRFKN